MSPSKGGIYEVRTVDRDSFFGDQPAVLHRRGRKGVSLIKLGKDHKVFYYKNDKKVELTAEKPSRSFSGDATLEFGESPGYRFGLKFSTSRQD